MNGCFWHKHNCHIFKWPKSRKEFWRTKILANAVRDVKKHEQIEALGWRVLIVWECSLKGKTKLPFEELIDSIELWLLHGEKSQEIPTAFPVDF